MDLVGPLRSRNVICTLGMHRSGTSLVSRMLNLLGVHLGTDQSLSGTNEDNPKGYWEHHTFALLNDEILARFLVEESRPRFNSLTMATSCCLIRTRVTFQTPLPMQVR